MRVRELPRKNRGPNAGYRRATRSIVFGVEDLPEQVGLCKLRVRRLMLGSPVSAGVHLGARCLPTLNEPALTVPLAQKRGFWRANKQLSGAPVETSYPAKFPHRSSQCTYRPAGQPGDEPDRFLNISRSRARSRGALADSDRGRI